MSDDFWFITPEILWKKERLTEFFPTKDQTLEEKFNALIRLSFYCSVVLFVYHNGNYKYWGIFFGTLLITYYIYTNRPGVTMSEVPEVPSVLKGSVSPIENDGFIGTSTVQKIETLDNVSSSSNTCTKPTIENPFMNVTMGDYLNVDPETHNIIDRPEACNTSDPEIKKSSDEFFNNNLFKDVNDVFGKLNSQRQFYTMPSTTIPNKQDEFARWLYLNPKTCKEDQDFCTPYEDLRGKRPVFYDPTKNPVETKRFEK